ncbi:hypothetical protein ACGFX4_25195 [Kitasatospora sp. NPDC048365]|uniref:hypothetical protein n=1 Tax=Kitasatospora sp. NPDC048365 TaxID=3364050 RepID=UPI003717D27A
MKIRTVAPGLREMQLDGEEWDAAYADRFAAGDCEGLLLGTAGPGRGTVDIGFVRDVPGLRSVRLGLGIADPGPIGDCPGLTRVQIGLDQRGRVDFSRLTGLTDLQAPPQVGIETVADLRELRELYVPGWRSGSLELLGAKPRLEFLRIECRRNGTLSLAGAEAMPAVRRMWIYDGRLSDTSRLTALHELTELSLIGAKPADLGFVAGLPALADLTLENCGPLPTLAPLVGHPSLREVAVTGSSTVADGDLHPLVDNPALTGIWLERGAPHYTHRPAQVRRG